MAAIDIVTTDSNIDPILLSGGTRALDDDVIIPDAPSPIPKQEPDLPPHYQLAERFVDWVESEEPSMTVKEALVEAYYEGDLSALELEGAMIDLVQQAYPWKPDLEALDRHMEILLGDDAYLCWKLLLSDNRPGYPDHNGIVSLLPVFDCCSESNEPSYVQRLEDFVFETEDLAEIWRVEETFLHADREGWPLPMLQDSLLVRYYWGVLSARLFHLAMLGLFRRHPLDFINRGFDTHMRSILGLDYDGWRRRIEIVPSGRY